MCWVFVLKWLNLKFSRPLLHKLNNSPIKSQSLLCRELKTQQKQHRDQKLTFLTVGTICAPWRTTIPAQSTLIHFSRENSFKNYNFCPIKIVEHSVEAKKEILEIRLVVNKSIVALYIDWSSVCDKIGEKRETTSNGEIREISKNRRRQLWNCLSMSE